MPVNKYETIFIAEPEISTEQVDELFSKIKSTVSAHQGSIISEDRWGRRRLAYSIHGHREGFYALVNFAAEPAVVTALEHLYNVSGPVIRYLTVRQSEPSRKREARRERPAKNSTGRHGPTRAGGPSPRAPHDRGARTAVPPMPAVIQGRAPETLPTAPGMETSPRKGDQPQ